MDMTLACTNLTFTVILSHHSRLDRNWRGPSNTRPRADDFTRLYYVRSGRAHVRYEDMDYRLSPGHLYLFPGGQTFTYSCTRQVEILWCHFSALVHQAVSVFDLWRMKRQLPCTNSSQTEALFSALIKANASESPHDLRVHAPLLHLLSDFFDEPKPIIEKVQAIRRLEPALNRIVSSLHAPPTIPELARSVSLEPSYFSRFFKATLGVPPQTYILKKRIDAVKQELMATGRSLAALATEYGFCDEFHLSKMFKAREGMSPRRYREAAERPVP